jgi:uncharacterized protein YcbK (DUF882 family)
MSAIWTRRRWIQTVSAAGVGLALSRFSAAREAEKAPEVRHLELLNTHTSETVSLAYKRGGEFDTAALGSLKKLLRDHRNDELHEMDVRLYDQLFDLARAANCDPRFEIISGYRSPESNDAMSSRAGSGVAKKSLHMQGRAVDIRLKHCSCADLRDLALTAKQGGVGYYQRSDFVHVDTGAFRTWVG